jgi:hypothetical protein
MLRFRMNLGNTYSAKSVQDQNNSVNIGLVQTQVRNSTFNNSMIGRVHSSKTGCSSCGH